MARALVQTLAGCRWMIGASTIVCACPYLTLLARALTRALVRALAGWLIGALTIMPLPLFDCIGSSVGSDAGLAAGWLIGLGAGSGTGSSIGLVVDWLEEDGGGKNSNGGSNGGIWSSGSEHRSDDKGNISESEGVHARGK
jgi:hypothetical protein